MKLLFKYISIWAIIFFTFFSCVKENIAIPEPALTYSIRDTIIEGQTFKKIQGYINESVTLGNTYQYFLEGGIYVEDSLTIEKGTILYADVNKPTYMVFNRGATIIANGTKEQPIVFTSINDIYGTSQAGDWVGIHINGNASINNRDGSLTEIIGKYGRTDASSNDLDNSGILKYCRIEFAGQSINGVTGALNLNGLGLNTTIEHIQVFNSNSNGIRLRGGATGLKYCMVKNSIGKSFRWDNGWKGFGQFWVAYYNQNGSDTITAIEGRSGTLLDLPISNPTISNISIIGTNTQSSNLIVRGIRFRDATNGHIYNSLITNCKRAVRADFAENKIESGNLSFSYNNLFENDPDYYSSSSSVAELFDDNVFMNTHEYIEINDYIGTIEDNQTFPIQNINEWFDDVNFKGAVEFDNDWTSDWIR